MLTDFSSDLGITSAMQELKRNALALQTTINETIQGADPEMVPHCVQWRTSRCVSVAMVLTGPRVGVEWVVMITKPAGPFDQLEEYLRPRLPHTRGVKVHLVCM